MQNQSIVNDKCNLVPQDFRRFRVSASNPCPICGKHDWCLAGDGWAICQRVESGIPWSGAGWLHRLTDDQKQRQRLIERPKAAPREKVHPWIPNGKPVAVYYYNHPDGRPNFRKVRYYIDGEKITPFQRYDAARDCWISGSGCCDGLPRYPYKIEQFPNFKTIWVVEGEKCCDLLWHFGLLATTSGGCKTWPKDFPKYFDDKHVIVLPDNDTYGREYGQTVARSLQGHAKSIKMIELPGLGDGDDVYDYLLREGI